MALTSDYALRFLQPYSPMYQNPKRGLAAQTILSCNAQKA
jgi:hypothetical protein